MLYKCTSIQVVHDLLGVPPLLWVLRGQNPGSTYGLWYSTDIVFLCRFSVWGVFPRRFRLVWQTVFLRFRLHRFVPFSIRKSVCVTDQSKAVTRRFLSLQKTSFTHAQILQTKTAFAETLFRQEPIRFT